MLYQSMMIDIQKPKQGFTAIKFASTFVALM